MFGHAAPTPDRERKLEALKKKMVSAYGSSLLKIKEGRTLEVLRNTDTPEERAKKIESNRQIVAEREEMYKLNEHEMRAELDKIVARIDATPKPARAEGINALTESVAQSSSTYCTECKNKDRNFFYSDPFSGDVICEGVEGSGCGAVVVDHEIFTGAEKRNFENEEDRNHFGPAPNKLMPDVVNMETSMLTMVNGRESAAFKRLAQAQRNIELNLDTIGRDDKHTRMGYKIKMKRKAFGLLEEIGTTLNLHQAVINRAKERFSDYRDVRDAVHDFEASILACLVLAYEELSSMQQVDMPKRSFEVNVDIGAPARARVLPARADVRSDAAICTVPEHAIGQFSLDDVAKWLAAVADAALVEHGEAFAALARHVAEHLGKVVAAQMAEHGKSKDREGRKAESSLFGMTTISQRMNRLSNNTGEEPAGRFFLRLNITGEAQKLLSNASKAPPAETEQAEIRRLLAAVKPANTVELMFKNALRRRSQYDKSLAEQEQELAQQRKRLRTEENNSVPQKLRLAEEFKKKQCGTEVQVSAATPAAPSSGDGATTGDMELLEMDLEDLIGGAVTVLPSAPAPSSTLPPSVVVASGVHVKIEHVKAEPMEETEVKVEPVKSEPVKVETQPAVKAPDAKPTAAAASAVKKVGARPRPKIVLM